MADFNLFAGISDGGVLASLALLAAIGGIGVVMLFKTVDDRFPPVIIEVWDRGFKQKLKFRLWGQNIVNDDMYALLTGDIKWVGDIRDMEFDIVPRNSIIGGNAGNAREYRAYRRSDYLFALHKNKTVTTQADPNVPPVEVEITKIAPLISIETDDKKKYRMKFDERGILVPFSIIRTNEVLNELEIKKGKDIAARFISNRKSNQTFLEASNPIMMVLLAVAPLVFLVLAEGVVLYLILNSALNKMTTIAALLGDK